jgi:hypothetical protein
MTENAPAAQPFPALLPYGLTCTPNPLYVSTETGGQELGKLTLQIGRMMPPLPGPAFAEAGYGYGPDGTGGGDLAPDSGNQVWCRQIIVDLPLGETPGDLAVIRDQSVLNTVDARLPNWTVSKALIPATNPATARVTFTAPQRGNVVLPVLFDGDDYVTATIDKIPVNSAPGTATITITETTSSTSAADGYELRETVRTAGDAPDPRDAQITRLKQARDDLRQKLADRDAAIRALEQFKELALSRLAAQHDEITRLRRQAATAGNVRGIASRPPGGAGPRQPGDLRPPPG